MACAISEGFLETPETSLKLLLKYSLRTLIFQISMGSSLGLYTIVIILLSSSVAILLVFILPVLNYQQSSVNIATKFNLRMLIFKISWGSMPPDPSTKLLLCTLWNDFYLCAPPPPPPLLLAKSWSAFDSLPSYKVTIRALHTMTV